MEEYLKEQSYFLQKGIALVFLTTLGQHEYLNEQSYFPQKGVVHVFFYHSRTTWM
jgi:hypothetical protein